MKKRRINPEPAIVATRKRVFIISVSFLLFAVFLASNLFKLQYLSHAYYKEKVFDQVTTSASLKARRGTIYDSSMNVLATTETSWRVFVSSKDIKEAEKKSGKAYAEKIADGLSRILKLDYTSLLKKIKNTSVLDVTVKKSIEEDEYEAVMEFITKNGLYNLVFTEAQSSRYYPNATLAAHVLGFCGSDNQGLYGLE